jgi:endonuclease/exonuclease/phosphatase family metal-dependent hydrolase
MKRNIVGIATAAILGALVAGAAIFALMRDGSRKTDVPSRPLVSVEEIKQIAGPVTVLTYNTHLFGGSNAEPAHKLKKIVERAKGEILYQDDNRAELIALKLETCGADIVALQELWACGRPKWFAEKLQKIYPYSYYYTDSEQCREVTFAKLFLEVGSAYGWSYVGKLIKEGAPAAKAAAEKAAKNVIRKYYKLMNGLLLLSKYPIEMPRFHEFPVDRAQRAEDQLARKGIITATIVLPNGLPFRVGVTYANTDVGGQSQPDIADLAYWTTMGALKIGPAIMMGDLNVGDNDDDGAKYNKMAKIFTGVGALDADRQVNKRNGITVNWASNQLLQYFFPKLTDTRKCIDYVFYRPDGPALTIKPESAKVITDWKYPVLMNGKTIEMDLSDHYPVVVTFGVWAGPKPITQVDPEPPRAR